MGAFAAPSAGAAACLGCTGNLPPFFFLMAHRPLQQEGRRAGSVGTCQWGAAAAAARRCHGGLAGVCHVMIGEMDAVLDLLPGGRQLVAGQWRCPTNLLARVRLRPAARIYRCTGYCSSLWPAVCPSATPGKARDAPRAPASCMAAGRPPNASHTAQHSRTTAWAVNSPAMVRLAAALLHNAASDLLGHGCDCWTKAGLWCPERGRGGRGRRLHARRPWCPRGLGDIGTVLSAAWLIPLGVHCWRGGVAPAQALPVLATCDTFQRRHAKA